MACDSATRRPRSRQAPVLPVGGISSGALPAERPVEPRFGTDRRGAHGGCQHGTRLRRRDCARGGSGSWQRRPRPARRVFPRFAGDFAISGDGLRHPLRLRHLHAIHRHRWRATRIRQHLVAAAQRVGNTTIGRAVHRAFRWPRREYARCRRRAAFTLGRNPGHPRRGFRSARARQSQPDRESPAAVVGPRAAAVSHRRFQRRQLSGRGRRPDRREEPVARAVPGRLHAAGQGAALQTAVLLRQRQHPGHPRHASRRRTRARRPARARSPCR